MSEYSIRRVISLSGVTDVRFVDSSASTPTFSGITINNDLGVGGIISGDGSGITNLVLSGASNYYVTGFTYDNLNQLTLERNGGLNDLTTSINVLSAVTISNYIDFEDNGDPTPVSGRTYYDSSENALSYYPQTSNMDVTINLGQESVTRVYNNTGVQINNGQACHVNGSLNGVPTVELSIASGITDVTDTIFEVDGLATHNIPNGTAGFITNIGLVRDLTITGTTNGSDVWLSDIEPGSLIYTLPTNISSRVSKVGHVVTTGVTTGKILVNISNSDVGSLLSAKQVDVISQNNYSTGVREGGEFQPITSDVIWGSITGITVTDLTGETGTYVYLDSNGNTFQLPNSSVPTGADRRNYIFLGLLGHANKTNLVNVFNTPNIVASPVSQLNDLSSSIGSFSINGNVITSIGGTFELVKSDGSSYTNGGNFINDQNNPSVKLTPLLSGTTLVYAKQDAVLGPSGTTVDTQNYDLNGVITPIPNNPDITAHRIWHEPINNLLIFQYGQTLYSTLSSAKENFALDEYIVPNGLSQVAYLVAVIITDADDINLDTAVIIPQGKFAGTGGGGGLSVTSLQSAYNNSDSPEIVTDTTRGGVDFKAGSGLDTINLVTFQDDNGDINGYVTGEGNSSFSNLIVDNNTTLSGLTTVYGDTPTSAAIQPGVNNTYDLGAPSFRWREIFSTNVDISNTLSTEFLYVNNTSSFNGDVDITGNTTNIGNLLVVGDVSGTTFYGDGSNLTNITATWDGREVITVGEDVNGGDLLYLGSGSTYLKVSNTSDTTSSTELRITISGITSGNSGAGIIQGKYTTTGLTAGDKYWVGASGDYTNIQPTGDGDIVRYIGTALSSTELEFNPDELFIELSSSSGSGTQPSFLNVSGSSSILTTDYTLNVVSTGDTTQTLPTAIGVIGKVYNIVNSGGGIVTVATTASQTINGSIGIIMTEQYLSRTFQSDGSNWILI
jgi:hypothetical protein